MVCYSIRTHWHAMSSLLAEKNHCRVSATHIIFVMSSRVEIPTASELLSSHINKSSPDCQAKFHPFFFFLAIFTASICLLGGLGALRYARALLARQDQVSWCSTGISQISRAENLYLGGERNVLCSPISKIRP